MIKIDKKSKLKDYCEDEFGPAKRYDFDSTKDVIFVELHRGDTRGVRLLPYQKGRFYELLEEYKGE